MELITQNTERIEKLITGLSDSINAVNTLIDKNKPVFNGEYYITDYELSQKIKKLAGEHFKNIEIKEFYHIFIWVEKLFIRNPILKNC